MAIGHPSHVAQRNPPGEQAVPNGRNLDRDALDAAVPEDDADEPQVADPPRKPFRLRDGARAVGFERKVRFSISRFRDFTALRFQML